MRSFVWSIILTLASLDASLATAEANTAAIGIDVPKTIESDVPIVDQSFLGFATESSSFPYFTNDFSQNLFNVFHNATGAPVIFRVGGTSMDHSIFDMNQEEDFRYPQGRPQGLQSNITFGKNWFRGFASLENLKFILHVPLARKNLTNAVKFTSQCLQTMGNVNKLEALEIGNEVDVYAREGWRPRQTWDPRDYANEVKTYMDIITNNVTAFPKTGRIFQIYDKGTEIDWPTNKNWTIENFMGNVSQIVDMSRVKQVAEHYYQARANDSVQDVLLNHQYTVDFTRNQSKPELDYLHAHNKNLDFVLSEVANALGSSGSESNDTDLSASLASAVWTVDWMLYAMSINVSRVNMQMGRTFAFAAWQPNPTNDTNNNIVPPHLNGGFYGHVFVADFIGSKGGLQIQQLAQPAGNKHISAYAGYHGGKLAKVAVTNQKLWKKSSGDRPSANVSVNVGLPDGKEVSIRKLTGPDGVALEGLTWGGKDWPYNGKNGPGMPIMVKNDTVIAKAQDGKVVVNIEATTAVLLAW